MKKTKVTKYCFLFCFFTYAVERPNTCKHTFVCKTGGVILVLLQSPAPPGVHMKRSSVYLNAPPLFDVSGCRLLCSPACLSNTLPTCCQSV